VEFLLIALISFIIMSLAVLGLATGVLFGRHPIRGSCGGMKEQGSCLCVEPCERKKQALHGRAEEDH
jgi:hypothetical protein